MIVPAGKDLSDVLRALESHRGSIVFTNGVFDILHAGHVTYLQAARDLGSVLVVGVNADESVRRLKGPDRPINSWEDRAIVLAALRSVDHIVYFDDDTPLRLITAILPNVLVKGGDYQRDTIIGADVVEEHGGRVLTIDLLEGRSTTNIINRVQKA